MTEQSPTEVAIQRFRDHGGTLRTRDALRLGIHPRTLYALRDSGTLEHLSRGLYRLADLPPLSNPDLIVVACKVPQAVICLMSALSFHELTTQIPRVVDVALRSHSARPRLDFPPLRTFWFSDKAWRAGLQTHKFEGVEVRIYDPTKTVADCFKFRRKLGLDVALEALRLFLKRSDFEVETLFNYARVCRVEKVMRPYVEALL